MNLKKKGKAKMHQIILVYLLLTCILIMKKMVISTLIKSEKSSVV